MHDARRHGSCIVSLSCVGILSSHTKKTGRVSCNDQKWKKKKTCINSKWNLNGDAYDWIHHSNVDLNSFTHTLPGSHGYNRSELTCRVGTTAFLAMSVRIYGLSESRKRRMPKSGTVEMEQREKKANVMPATWILNRFQTGFATSGEFESAFCSYYLWMEYIVECAFVCDVGLRVAHCRGPTTFLVACALARACVPLLCRIIWCAFVKRLKFYSILMSCFVFDSRRWQMTVACDANALAI